MTVHCGAVKRSAPPASAPFDVTRNFMRGKTQASVAHANAAKRAMLYCSMIRLRP